MKRRIRYRDLFLLTNLFSVIPDWIVIFDPENRVEKDLNGKFILSDNSTELVEWISSHPKQRCVLFNFANEPVLNLYCLKNVHTIIEFSKNRRKEDEASCFAYKRGPSGALQWIYPASSMQAVLTEGSIHNGTGGLSWKSKVHKQLFRFGLGDSLVDGFFNHYYKHENALENRINSFNYDDYYLLVGPTTKAHQLAWIQLVKDKAPAKRLSLEFKLPVDKTFKEGFDQIELSGVKASNFTGVGEDATDKAKQPGSSA